jgi:hypothetical protein
MKAVFEIDAHEFDRTFFDNIKSLIEDRRIRITIETEADETDYLLSNPATRKQLLDAINSDEGYSFTPEEFDDLTHRLEQGEKIDVSMFRKIKLTK